MNNVSPRKIGIIGGDSGKGGQALNPFDAVGLESFMRINEKMTNTKSEE